jgi:hypothetical protein
MSGSGKAAGAFYQDEPSSPAVSGDRHTKHEPRRGTSTRRSPTVMSPVHPRSTRLSQSILSVLEFVI